MERKPPKPKSCAVCKKEFLPARVGQKVCSFYCAVEKVNADNLRKAMVKPRRRSKEVLDNSLSHWQKKAMMACHAYIRWRDRDDPCISCGRHHKGQYHAGHYRPAGINSALRYDERNIHKQCAPCNNHKSGNLVEYRKSLISKLGADVVQWLDDNHETKRWTIAELKQITDYYRKKMEAGKVLRTAILALDEAWNGKCCDGGPQWGHAWNCPKLP